MVCMTKLAACAVALLIGCGGSADEPAAATSDTGTLPESDGGTTPTTPCEEFGKYPAPEVVFTLPSGKESLAYTDVQKSFPEVDWAKLDRLYIPAGKYKTLQLGNLPKREATRPLVITNLGGQVQVGPNLGGNFIWSMGGGSNWVLTGRYDPIAKTGDAAFPGHRCGDFAGSRGKYGFLSDDAFDHSAPYLHMGVAVSGSTSFELEYLEVMRSGFAGIRLINSRGAGDSPMPMENVRVHDNYLHDIDAEGFYFGWTGAPPSNLFPKLTIYNNRIVRTGNESLQIQDLGDGTEVHHNVFAYASLHWRDNGLGKYQDFNTQIGARSGKITLHHNVFIGGASQLVSMFSSPQTGDGERQITFHDNYFAETLAAGGYFGGTAGSGSSLTFENNAFRVLGFGYDKLDPAAKEPTVIFSKNGAFAAPITFRGNKHEGSRALMSGAFTAEGNVNAPVTPLTFRSESHKGHLEYWAAKATVADGDPPITYAVGDRVMFDLEMYEALTENTGKEPPAHPEAWKKLARPADDLRALPPYEALGVH